jgi:hypothetical protein
MPNLAPRVHVDRIAGGDRDHRHPGQSAPAGSQSGQGTRAAVRLYQRQQKLTLATLLYAGDNGERFMRDGDLDPHWVGRPFRDMIASNYSVPRRLFYCPSNPHWNRDDFWSYPDGTSTVLGYIYYVGEPDWNTTRNLHYRPVTNQPIFALKATDTPHYQLVWGDINRKYQNSWFRPGDPNPLTRGVNHFNRSGNAPAGANEGYLDGHVEWKNGRKFLREPRMRFGGSLLLYFHGGFDLPK